MLERLAGPRWRRVVTRSERRERIVTKWAVETIQDARRETNAVVSTSSHHLAASAFVLPLSPTLVARDRQRTGPATSKFLARFHSKHCFHCVHTVKFLVFDVHTSPINRSWFYGTLHM